MKIIPMKQYGEANIILEEYSKSNHLEMAKSDEDYDTFMSRDLEATTNDCTKR